MNVRKRLFRRLDKAAEALSSKAAVEGRVHEARRQLKKARALLALGRPALKRKRARRGEENLREAGRALSAVRDAEIAARAYASLRTRARGPGASLEARRAAAERAFGTARKAALRRMEGARRDLARMGRPGDKALGRAARRSFDALLRRGEAALLAPDDAALHSWRKAAKRLDGILGEASKPTARLRRLRERASELGDALGDDHDLVIVGAALERAGGGEPERAEAARRRAALLEKAARLAPALPRDAPRRLAREYRRSL
jgi:hypothetical protein